MKNSEYWRNRLIEVKKHQINADNAYLGALEVEYRMALHSLNGDIETWITRLAKNNEVSLADARKLLSANELEEFHWAVQEYIKRGKENGISHDWSKQLENASARVHISRFEALKTQIRGELEKLNTIQTEGINAHLSEAFTETYYHTAYEIQTGMGVGIQLNRFSVSDVEKVLKKPWTPDKNTFRDRCWVNKEKLISELETGIAQSLIRGDSTDSLIRQISDRFDVEMHKAATLVTTESAYFASVAEDECYRDLGVGVYEINAVLDAGTCAKCGEMDGKIFDMKDHVIGVTSPPFHPRCRCDKVPHFNDLQGGQRFARNDEGKTEYVPADMKYTDWKRKFVSEPETKKAKAALEKATQEEPSVTKDLEMASRGTQVALSGLDYKIKSLPSLSRKIKASPDKLVRDVLRYTYTSTPENMVKDYEDIVAKLIKSGYTVSGVKNYWNVPYNPYNGINTFVKTPSGYEFEIQYHTKESFELKNGSLHELYEKARLLDEASPEYLKLQQKMFELSDSLQVPKNIGAIKEVK